ncbi:MAG TPA: hypothetical protein VFS08_08515 [Gemmatimonadaceae bacterium]|nr:hypothetical protein [Gemmatimonadaceae bacterium]
MTDCTRRRAVTLLVRAAGAVALTGPARALAAATPPAGRVARARSSVAFRVAILTPTDAAAAAGATFGLAEVARTAAALGALIEGVSVATPTAARAALRERRANALVVDGAAAACAELAAAAQAAGALVVEAWPGATPCGAPAAVVTRVAPDDVTRAGLLARAAPGELAARRWVVVAAEGAAASAIAAAAERGLRAAGVDAVAHVTGRTEAALPAHDARLVCEPGAVRAELVGADGAAAETLRVVAWHPSLEKYGAAQLDARFRAAAGRPMDERAWCGWAATKLLGETYLRVRSPGETGAPETGTPETGATAAAALTAAMREAILAPTLRFDGQKGRPLTVRASDHALRQPLYVVRAPASAHDGPEVGRVVAEVAVEAGA